MVTKTLLQQIGKAISIARCRANLTQLGLNYWAKMPEGTHKVNQIAKLERGELNITIETLERIAATCGCRVEIKLRYDRKPKSLKVDEEVPEDIQRLRDALKVV